MAVRRKIVGIDRPEALESALRSAQYLADGGLATAAYLALALGKPLLLEGAPGVGKTEAAKAMASVLGRELTPLATGLLSAAAVLAVLAGQVIEDVHDSMWLEMMPPNAELARWALPPDQARGIVASELLRGMVPRPGGIAFYREPRPTGRPFGLRPARHRARAGRLAVHRPHQPRLRPPHRIRLRRRLGPADLHRRPGRHQPPRH